jgi:hypothetical protein
MSCLVRTKGRPLIPRCDPHPAFKHAKVTYRDFCLDDALQTNERAIVNMVDDDTSMRGALESVLDSVATLRPARGCVAMQLANKPG